jgi:hypothetical protein
MFSRRLHSTLHAVARRSFSHHLKAFATVDPNHMTGKDRGFNLIDGEWCSTQ